VLPLTALSSGVITVGGEVVGIDFSEMADAIRDLDTSNVGNIFEDAYDAAASAASAAASIVTDPVEAARDLLETIENAANDLADRLPDALKPFAYGVAEVAKVADKIGLGTAEDIVRIANEIPWAQINSAIQAAVSVVPVLGTAVSDVLAAAEIAINAFQALASGEWLKLALLAAYKFALANIPAAASLRLVLDPAVDAIIRIALGGEAPTSALVHAVVDSVPDAPKIGHLSPRTIAASLMQIVVEHRGLKDVGLDLASEAAGAAGPLAERAVRTAETMLDKGFDPMQALDIALDMAPVPIGLRKSVEDLQAKIRSLPDLIPEEIAALGAQKLPGVWEAVKVTHGGMPDNTIDRLTDMMGHGKSAAQSMYIEAQLHDYVLPLGLLPPGAAAVDYSLPMSMMPSIVPNIVPAPKRVTLTHLEKSPTPTRAPVVPVIRTDPTSTFVAPTPVGPIRAKKPVTLHRITKS
jgi:hypothetical protein